MPSAHARIALVLSLNVVLAAPAGAQPASPDEPPPLDPEGLRRALAANPAGAAATALVDKLRRWFGAETIKHGMAAKTEGLDAAFALEVPGAKAVSARSLDGLLKLPLTAIPGTDVWAAVHTLSDGTQLRFHYEVDGRRLGAANVETFALLPDSLPQPGVPKGKVIAQKRWKSKVYPDTERDWWIYVPAQYRGKPVGVMVFQDGANQYLKPIPTVFDNLIHRGDMPVTAAIFINPGVFADGRRNRGAEYEPLTGDYARFLLEEILPEAEKTVKLRRDPQNRAIAGMSSGGLCAFTAAWQRPDQFGKVLSWAGTFVNVGPTATQFAGGHNYPAMIRRTPRKPVRVFLQSGAQDLEEEGGSWTLANQEMDRALTFARWDFRIVYGKGFHSTKHGYAILPESLRWLYRDHRQPAAR